MQHALTDRLVDTATAADILGLSPATLKYWRVTGHRAGPVFVRLGTRPASEANRGSQVRYSLRALQRWIAARTVRVGKAAKR